jgi:ADP-ribosylation factor GTPase-activating protein 1
MAANLDGAQIEDLQNMPGNIECMDCDAIAPDWCSISFGILLCVNCSGKHRSLGTHISYVRSIHMDVFKKTELKKLQNGGNKLLKEHFRTNGVDLRQPTAGIPQVSSSL